MSSRQCGVDGFIHPKPEAPCRNPRHVGGYLAKKKNRRLLAVGRKGAISWVLEGMIRWLLCKAGDDYFIDSYDFLGVFPLRKTGYVKVSNISWGGIGRFP